MSNSSPEKNASFNTKNARYKAAEQAIAEIEVRENIL
jgi:hypothetical protein